MATSTRGTRTVHRTVLAATAALTVAVAPGLSRAEPPPPTSADARQQVRDLGDQLEVVTEEYNAARIQLGQASAARTRAEARAAALDARLENLAGKVRHLASSAYRTVPLSEFTALLSSDSPEQFLSQLSTLDVLSRRRAAALDALEQAAGQARQARTAATNAAAEAQQIVDGLQAKKSTIEQQLTRQQSLLSRLTARERAAVFDAGEPVGGKANGTGPALPPAAGAARVAVDAALSKLGSPYVWAADGPDSFDCSGLTMWAWGQAGVRLPHQSRLQYDVGTRVGVEQLRPGDLVFFHQPIHHVGIYLGNGRMVHAPTSGDVVKVSPLDMATYTGATRVG